MRAIEHPDFVTAPLWLEGGLMRIVMRKNQGGGSDVRHHRRR
jgi:hypothetical protein